MSATAAGRGQPDGDRGGRRWEPMKLQYLGHVGALMRGEVGTTKDGNGENCMLVDKRNRPC